MANLQRSSTLIIDRDTDERRRLSWRTLVYGYLRSRRRGRRRQDEPPPTYTDWHHPWLFFLATGIMLLSCLDAFLTLQLLDRGAVEINPVMAAMMGQGTPTFAATKMLLTGFGILMLVFLSRSRVFNLVRTGLILTAVFSMYACLVCYEFIYLLRVV